MKNTEKTNQHKNPTKGPVVLIASLSFIIITVSEFCLTLSYSHIDLKFDV